VRAQRKESVPEGVERIFRRCVIVRSVFER